tara:strand:- start:906 stop:1412 length:507 start_codon:yes stop_codon:yes gene_type:complete
MVSQYLNCWKQYFNIKGRTNRKDFFGFVILDLILILFLVWSGFYSQRNTFPMEEEPIWTFLVLYFLVGICPRVSIYIRRIRDAGRDPNWILWCIFPVIGWFIIFILVMQPTFKSIENPRNKEENNNLQDNKKISSLESKLKELKRLKDQELVTNEEYEELRKKYLDLK